jgi:hypothetical protein
MDALQSSFNTYFEQQAMLATLAPMLEHLEALLALATTPDYQARINAAIGELHGIVEACVE